jgi:Di- and tricarboxylate transporters
MSQEKAKPKSEINITRVLITIAVGVIVAFIPPPTGLTVLSMRYLGIFLAMIIGMVINAAPTWVVSTLSALAMVGFKLTSMSKVMANYAGSTVWMLLAVMGFAGCVAQSGLMKRIAFNVLKFFPPTFTGQVLAISAASIVLTPLIPSTSAKLAVLAPFTASIAAETGLEPHSKGLKGLTFSLFNICFVGAFAVLTGSNGNFILLGFVPAAEAASFTWMYWFRASIVWWIVLVVCSILVSIFFFQPEKPINMSADFIKSRLAELGPMSMDEKICMATLIGAVGMWMTESMHGVSSAVVAWLAFTVMIFRGLFTSRDVGTKLPWGLILFFASMMGVVDYMGESGLTGWIAELLGPIVGKVIPNAFVFVIVLTVVTWLIRLGVDSISILAINVAIFGPVATLLGINPWLVVWLTFVNGQQWILPHNQIQLLQCSAMMGGVIDHKDMQGMTWFYMIISLAGSLISVPVWVAMGLIA